MDLITKIKISFEQETLKKVEFQTSKSNVYLACKKYIYYSLIGPILEAKCYLDIGVFD